MAEPRPLGGPAPETRPTQPPIPGAPAADTATTTATTASPTPTGQASPRKVNWGRVGLFYGIAFGGAILVALIIWALRGLGNIGVGLGTLVTAVCYMPLPMAAGLITERVAGNGFAIGAELRAMRGRVWRTLGRNAGIAILLILAVLALGFAAAWLAGTLGVPGAGQLVASDADLHLRLREVSPGLPATTPLPSIWLVLVSSLIPGIAAGVTVNALFAFGEEYGWRGVLADELRPLGLVKATALTGVLWGLWHAPIIVLGHNYGAQWGWGIPLMVTWTVPLAFLLTWSRERTGSVLAPSFGHGLYNALIGLFTLLIIGGNLLVALPMGILAGATLGVLALLVWRLPAHPPAR